VSAAAVVEIVFAVSIVVAAATLLGAWLDRLAPKQIAVVAAVLGAAALAAWIVFALKLETDLAVAAAGITTTFLVALGAMAVHRGVLYAHRSEAEVRRAEARLDEALARGVQERTIEAERLVARVRADSLSLLQEEERRIAEERRAIVEERERSAAVALNEALETTQRRVEQRLAEWGEDLERAQAHLFEQLQRLADRQRRLIQEAEGRLAADAERLESESEAHRASLVRLRREVEQATESAMASATGELEAHSVDRRAALNELNERLHRRERELREELDRNENEAIHSIQATFADVERRLVERLERVVERTTAQHADAAATQFSDAIKRSREASAQRLSRELERAVEMFTRQAESAIADRLTSVGHEAAQRLERRLADADASIATRRDEVVSAVEQRLAAAEHDLRLRLDELAADADAQRGILDARLFELQRRIDAALAHAQALE
jgi:hypothetical protein